MGLLTSCIGDSLDVMSFGTVHIKHRIDVSDTFTDVPTGSRYLECKCTHGVNSAFHKAASSLVTGHSQNSLWGAFRLAGPINSQWTLFCSTGIVPVEIMERSGTVRPVALWIALVNDPQTPFPIDGFMAFWGIVPGKARNGSAGGLVNSKYYSQSCRPHGSWPFHDFAWYNSWNSHKPWMELAAGMAPRDGSNQQEVINHYFLEWTADCQPKPDLHIWRKKIRNQH